MFNLFKKDTPESSLNTQSGNDERPAKKPFAGWLGQLLSHLPQGSDAEPITEADFETLEDMLIKSDLGIELSVEIVDELRKQPIKTRVALTQGLKAQLKNIIQPLSSQFKLQYNPQVLNVYFVVGVNGGGKTTTIGKLAHRFQQKGDKVLIAAADTFRAAAVEQLEVWAQRAGVGFISLDKGNPAAVVYEAVEKAKAENANVLIIDTAGRLQNKFNLMEELKKLTETMDKQLPPSALVEKLLVVDATIGQNALQQAQLFKEVVDLDGLVLTKVDGSGKGGTVFAIAKQYQLPVKLMGCGEKMTDLMDFEPDTFIEMLFEDTH